MHRDDPYVVPACPAGAGQLIRFYCELQLLKRGRYDSPIDHLRDLCRPRRNREGAEFAAQIRDGFPIDVSVVDCLNICDKPVSFALQGPGLASYVFAGLDPARDGSDLRALAEIYAKAPGGEIADARPAGRLRSCLVAKLPAV